jgi:FMN phosphatase YigB (HAD superfamily)
VIVVFDLDNTLADEFGSAARPGIANLLERLRADGHTLILWTNSKRDRARVILYELKLIRCFDSFLFREDYDVEETDVPKDLRRVNGDFIVDDDPKQIEFARSIGKDGFCIKPFRKGRPPDPADLERVRQALDARRRP